MLDHVGWWFILKKILHVLNHRGPGWRGPGTSMMVSSRRRPWRKWWFHVISIGISSPCYGSLDEFHQHQTLKVSKVRKSFPMFPGKKRHETGDWRPPGGFHCGNVAWLRFRRANRWWTDWKDSRTSSRSPSRVPNRMASEVPISRDFSWVSMGDFQMWKMDDIWCSSLWMVTNY